jgi:dihydroorotate dehydrogenase electron transfer subunit
MTGRTPRAATRKAPIVRIGPARQLIGFDPPSALHPAGNVFPRKILSLVLQSATKPNGLVLDPLSACGDTAVEILRLGRRAALIELNPVSAFFAEVNLRPASLPRLTWAFADVRSSAAAGLAELFATACPKCGGHGTGMRYHRRNGKLIRIEYACRCSRARLTKKPDTRDAEREAGLDRLWIPQWHPARLPDADPVPIRTTAALSILLQAIEIIPKQTPRDALKAAFAGCLPSVYFRKPPLRRNETIEENPWIAFEAAFQRVYAAKQTGNRILDNAAVGRSYADLEAGRANVVLLSRASAAAEGADLPGGSAECIVASLPSPAGTAGLTSVQAAWLRLDLDPEWDIVAEPDGAGAGPSAAGMLAAFRAIRRAGKAGAAVYLFLPDRLAGKPAEWIHHLERGRMTPESVRYQPPPDSSVRRAGASVPLEGGYILKARLLAPGEAPAAPVAEDVLRAKLAAAAKLRIAVHGSKTTYDQILHAFYQTLSPAELASVSEYPIEELFQKDAGPFARWRNGKLVLRKGGVPARSKLLHLWRETLLDAEALAAGDPADADAARAAALETLFQSGGTAEDSCRIRGRIRAAEIARRRIERAVALLQAWGKALGHAVRTMKGADAGVVWKASGGEKVIFHLGRKTVAVAGADKKGNRSEWGGLSYLNLELQAQRWFRLHPGGGPPASGRWIPLTHLPDAEGFSAPVRISPPKDLRLKVVQNREICGRHYLLTVELPKDVKMDFRPGQFFHILCDPQAGAGDDPPLALRRPLSIHRAGYPGFRHTALADAADLPVELREGLVRRPSRIDFLYRVVGEGTEILRRTPKGAFLAGIGPIGKGFDTSGIGTAVIVAGGIGIAPLAALAEALRFEGKEVLVYVGATGGEMLNLAVTRDGISPADKPGLLEAIEAEFREIGAQLLGACTDDGSIGRKALVTDLLEQGLRDGCVPRSGVRLYACGPTAMLRTVAAIAAREGLDCQVSLEERMACGIGACYSCTVGIKQPDGAVLKKRVCREGPVFPARDIQWKD